MSESSNDLTLVHYGVKGMRWGQRKNDGGSPRKGVIQRIKERDAKIETAREKRPEAYATELKAVGASAKAKAGLLKNPRDPQARQRAREATASRRKASENRRNLEDEAGKLTSKEIALKGVTWATPIVIGSAQLASYTRANNRNAREGREFAAGLFSDTNGLPAPNTIALQYNSSTNTWE